MSVYLRFLKQKQTKCTKLFISLKLSGWEVHGSVSWTKKKRIKLSNNETKDKHDEMTMRLRMSGMGKRRYKVISIDT